jgi:hypothetical protein
LKFKQTHEGPKSLTEQEQLALPLEIQNQPKDKIRTRQTQTTPNNAAQAHPETR